MLDVVREGFKRANQVKIAIAFLRFSGLALIEKDIINFLNRGGQLQVIASTYLGHTQPQAIRALRDLSSIDNVRIFDNSFLGFHMKLFLFNGHDQEIWVGSTNLTKAGLTTNWEMNLCYQDKVAFEIGETEFDIAWSNSASKEPSETFITNYEERLKKIIIPNSWIASNLNAINTLVEPNEAQQEALQRLKATRDNLGSKALIVAAPGVGKTYIAAFDARQAGAKNVLFLSHRLEHLRQAKKSFSDIFPELRQTICDGSTSGVDGDQVFATVQSASKREILHSRQWEYVVVDEFHHADAPSYQALLAKLSKGFLLGLTATPERADGHNVWQICDNHIAYEVRLVDAINRRWLVPFHHFSVSDDVVEYENIPWRNGGFDPTALENILSVEDRAELVIRHALLKGFDGISRATVGFCAGRKHARFMASYFNSKGMISETVLGDDPIEHRLDIYKRFTDPFDPLEWLFVADVLNEGVDIPAINTLLFLRPTDSATVFIQQLGRGLRLHPNCEVLTVIDFVGHHRKSWLGLKAINDLSATPDVRTICVDNVTITPPRNCEIILDDKTQQILSKVGIFRSKMQACIDGYEKLRDELGEPPFPDDLFGRQDLPSLRDFRDSFGTWIQCRIKMGDAEPWELNLNTNHQLFQLLDKSELDWQAQRIYPYAVLWAAVAYPENPMEGYKQFFERFTQWKAEWKPKGDSKVSQTMEKKLGSLWHGESLVPEVFHIVPQETLLKHIERRIGFVMQKDYKSRIGGVLRHPQDLELWKKYWRPEIINHFKRQYDPAIHNQGVIEFSKNDILYKEIIIIAKINTSGAHEQYHYKNFFETDGNIFSWQSQNSNTPESGIGKRIVTPGLAHLHLFVQPKSHTPAVYCGIVQPISHKSTNPIDVMYRLNLPVPNELLDELKT